MKVADLYAALRLQVDAATFKRGDDKMKQLGERIAKFGKDVNKAFGRSLNYAAAGLSAVIVAGAKDALDFDKALTTLYISSDRTMGTQAAMRDSFLELSRSTGIAKEQLVAAAQAYVALTGDGKGANAAVASFARVATASSSSIDDVAGAAASLSEQFGIMPNEMEQAFSALIRGGKAGKIELKDMNELMASLGAAFKQFDGSKGLGGVSAISGIFQVAARNFGSAAEASTGVERLLSNIQESEFRFAKLGISFRKSGKAGKGEFLDVVTIVEKLGKELDKDPKKFQQAFGANIIAKRGLMALYQNIDAVKELTAQTTGAKDVAEDLAYVQQSASFRAERSWNDVKVAIARAFTPARIESIAALLGKISSAIVSIVDKVGGAEHAVWLMVGAWTALKGMQLAGVIIPIVTQLTAMAAAGNMAAASAANALGLAGKLGALGLAGGVGYGVGTWLSHQMNLNKGDSGYNDDYQTPEYKAWRAKKKAARDAAAASMANPTASVPAVPAAAGRGGANVNVQTQINVSSNAASPVQVAREVKRQLDQTHRDTAAALAGG